MARSLEELASNQAAPPDNSTQQTPSPKGSKMTPEDLRTVATELKRFGTGLNLSREQKGQLKTFPDQKIPEAARIQAAESKRLER